MGYNKYIRKRLKERKKMTNEKFIVLDTETTNSIDDPIVYDIGFAVVDIEGNVYETHSYVVADVFLDKDLMASAYFIDKVPQYWEEIKNGSRLLRKYSTIRFILHDVCKQWNVKKIFAHHARFDYRSTTLTQRYLTNSKYRYFMPYGVEIWDTLKMARAILKDNDEYANFCYDNEYFTKGMQRRYTAEIIYRFLNNDVDFVENHTGLEDVMIEKEIMAFCFAADPKVNGKLFK